MQRALAKSALERTLLAFTVQDTPLEPLFGSPYNKQGKTSRQKVHLEANVKHTLKHFLTQIFKIKVEPAQ